MRYFPVFLDLDDAPVLVLGGGEQAAQKVRLLAKTPARITIMAPALNAELTRLADDGAVIWRKRDFAAQLIENDDLLQIQLIVIADIAPEAAQAAATLAKARGIPVNVVDGPDLSSFITPAIVERGPVTVAIGTEGAAPVLARRIKAQIDALLPAKLGALAEAAGKLRATVAEKLKFENRRRFWERFFDDAPARHFLSGDIAAFDRAVEYELEAAASERQGSVALIGAGPGDPDLLTLKAHRLLQLADVIVYDRLIGPDILDYARRDARRVPVGKQAGKPSIAQEEINRVLVREASAGHFVVRLKGGDPFVFGRGGEELAVLEATGIPVEIVPGITAAAGCAASIRLPLTHRGQNTQITLLTGMTGKGEAEHDWAALARPGAAAAIYMGLKQADHIAARLLGAGAEKTTPVVIVQDGTLASERVLVTDLGHLTRAVASHELTGPALIFLGLTPTQALTTHADVERYLAEDASEIVPFPLRGGELRGGER